MRRPSRPWRPRGALTRIFFGLEHRLKHPDGGLSAVRPIARQVREISACLPVGNRREGGQNEIWTKEPRCVWQFGAGTVYNIDIWKSQRVSGFFLRF